MKIHSTTIELDGKKITLETGLFAPQAAGAVTARCGDTLVLATVVNGGEVEGLDYFPLQVEYRDKHYAGGIISSSRFVKRETRPSDNETLTARLIDRSIRPLFPEDYKEEVQVLVNPLAIDGINEPEILGAIATSAALAISNIPWNGPLGTVRLGTDQDGKFLINPTNEQIKASKLDLLVSGTSDSIAMVEAGAQEATESTVLEALKASQPHLDTIVSAINELVAMVSPVKTKVLSVDKDEAKIALVTKEIGSLEDLVKGLAKKTLSLSPIIKTIVEKHEDQIEAKEVNKIIDDLTKDFIREQTLGKNIRPDGRSPEDIREISSQVALIPMVHGSGLFKRGLTHVLSVVTLGSPDKEQLIDGMKGEETRRYIHHYNMPGYAVGEPRRMGFTNRREVGHGALASKALEPVLPSHDEFPYTIRVVSEVMSGNGSTSQGSVCGSTLSLMDAGVPIKKPVAGIAMGLVTDGKKYITLSDISGLEDHTGDMDFKVAGTKDGITAIQMDVKVPGVKADILGEALEQARKARLHILEQMLKTIDKPRAEISPNAPHIETLTIDPEKIGEIIGPGGKVIRQIQKDFEVEIGVEDDGVVSITGKKADKTKEAKEYIKNLTAEAEVGKIYQGTVTRVESYGAFVEVIPGKQGLIHVSRLSNEFINSASDVVKEGDTIEVKVYEIDDQGRINLIPTNVKPKTDSHRKSFSPARKFQDHR
ncbi:polyribonucleotide nucleotidyltransferase [Patescibacteria group bacterium]|nr:polyribonucleotide nucleotidyltransferase [Patescibacteria group bacterium]MBU1256448.1 polyribonucleotide nucleotidyltransferase [Patescibacteria group bacterium]MBU1457319.1 polyribonucleotide nucleotidyltransferase [Patescibacteria group bacterium]